MVRVRQRPKPLVMPDKYRPTWATPQKSFATPYFTKVSRVLAAEGGIVRGFNNLVNQLFFEAETAKTYSTIPTDKLRYHYDANPQFAEWLMGYPRNWTLISCCSKQR
jgi:hypothetical protein